MFLQGKTHLSSSGLAGAALGGYTCHIDTLNSQEFLDATPYNSAFKESMNIFKDFWAVPEYGQLLETYSKTIGNYIIRDQGTAKQALDRLVEQWQEIFEEAGYID